MIAALDALRKEVECCSACVLASTRTRAVFGEGDPGADLMFVGEAPGYHEDQQGRPFVGQAGRLLDQLLASIGMSREQVYIANVLKSRPPNNRDPRPEEIDACRPYLFRQIEIIKPRVICTLGNFATKLLSGDQTGITKVHGRPRAMEIAGHALYLYPIFHPAAALYTPAMLTTLKEDISRLPQLLAHAAPKPGEEAAGPSAAERPAWRPPERLRQYEAPAAQRVQAPDDAPVREDASTLEDAARPAREPSPVLGDGDWGRPASGDGDGGRPAVGVATGADRTAPAAARRPPTSAATDPPVATSAATDPPASAESPPADPEQLGLF